MPRARNIKPGFFTNEQLVELPMSTRLLFIGLWTLADREGRLEDRPRRIKMHVFPTDSIDVDAGIDELGAAGFLERYIIEGSAYIQITNFHKHQNPHHRERESSIPPAPIHTGLTKGVEPRTTESSHDHARGEPRASPNLGQGKAQPRHNQALGKPEAGTDLGRANHNTKEHSEASETSTKDGEITRIAPRNNEAESENTKKPYLGTAKPGASPSDSHDSHDSHDCRDSHDSGARSRAAPIPKDFEFTEYHRAYLKRYAGHLDAELEFEEFRNHHEAKGSKFRNWDAAWRNWCTKAAKYNPRPTNRPRLKEL